MNEIPILLHAFYLNPKEKNQGRNNMDKLYKRISVLVLFGIMVLVLVAPTPSAVTYGPGIYAEESYSIYIDSDNNATNDAFIIAHDGSYWDQSSGEDLFRIQEDGKVGIKTQDPTNMLDVNGTVRVRDLPKDDTLNDIVVADANGVLHTRDVSTIGGFGFNIITVTDDYTPTNSDYTILIDASSNNVNIELPKATEAKGQVLVLKRVDDNNKNKVVIDPDDSETIDGDPTVTLNVKYMSYTIQSDGSDCSISCSFHDKN
jgi:hypothetical protein